MTSLLNQLGLNPEGPDGKEVTDRRKFVFQQTQTWTVEYDEPTKRILQVKLEADDKVY